MREANGSLVFFIVVLIVCLGLALQSNNSLRERLEGLEVAIQSQQSALLEYAERKSENALIIEKSRSLIENDKSILENFNNLNRFLLNGVRPQNSAKE